MTQRLLWPLTDLGETLDLYQRGDGLDPPDPRPARRRAADHRRAPARLPTPVARRRSSFDDVPLRLRRRPRRAARPRPRRARRRDARGRRPTGAGKCTLRAAAAALLRRRPAGGHRSTASTSASSTCASLRGAIGYVSPGRVPLPRHRRARTSPTASRTPPSGDRGGGAAAEAHDFIAALPDGYDTVSASAAEAVRRPAAAAVDRPGDPARPGRPACSTRPPRPSTTRPRRPSSGRWPTVGADRTVVVVAHRLSTVRHADRIRVLEAGGVAEAGTHDELVGERRSLRRPVARPDRRRRPPGPHPAPVDHLGAMRPGAYTKGRSPQGQGPSATTGSSSP